MAKSSLLIRQTLLSRPRRTVTTSSSGRSSTSPQRWKPAAAPAFSVDLKPFGDIPGPIALPMLRHSAHVLPRIGAFHHTVGLGLLEGLRDKYGDLVRLAKASRTRPVLYVFDPEMMREVYESGVTEPPRWTRSPLGHHRKISGSHCPVHGDESNAIWAAIRALLQDNTLLQCYDKAFDDIAADATRRLGDLRHAENALNEELETEVYRWALETIGVMMFGIRLGCLDGVAHIPTADNKTPEKTSLDDDTPDRCSLSKRSLEELSPAESLVRYAREIAGGNYLVRSEATLKKDSLVFNNALKALDRHYSLTEFFLQQATAELKSGTLRPEQAFLDKLRPLEGRILPLASDFLLAGVEPLVHSALSMLYQLSLHAAQQQRAHDQVAWAKESTDAGLEAPELPYIAACAKEALRIHPATGGVVRRSREELAVGGFEVPAGAKESTDAGLEAPELPYIAACAKEALRIHPATGGVVRRSREELAVGGFKVPDGVDIVLAHGVTSKSEKQWGRSKAFIPERWCNEGWEPLKASRAHPLASMPFGDACPATGVVGKMLTSLATRVLDKYRLEWHGPMPNITTTGVNKLQPPYYFVLQNAA